MSKKTNIAIIGDSFGDDKGCWPHRWSDVGPGWPELLSKNPDYSVENLSEGGASFWYCYQKFLGIYKDFDQIIFMVTQPGRLTKFIPNFSEGAPAYKHHPNLEQVLRWKKLVIEKNRISEALINLEAIENYFLYVKNDEYDEHVQWLFVEKIKRLKPNTVIVPCFYDSIKTLTTTPLCEVGHNELIQLHDGLDLKKIYKKLQDDGRSDARKCHMSEENNYVFYRLMLKFLQGVPVQINPNIFFRPSKKLDHYWRFD